MTAPKMPAAALPNWPRLLSAELGGAYLSMGAGCFRAHVAAGKLPPALVLGRRRLWDRLALDGAVDRLRIEAGSGRGGWR